MIFKPNITHPRNTLLSLFTTQLQFNINVQLYQSKQFKLTNNSNNMIFKSSITHPLNTLLSLFTTQSQFNINSKHYHIQQRDFFINFG